LSRAQFTDAIFRAYGTQRGRWKAGGIVLVRALPEAPCLARWGTDTGVGEENTEVAGKETENKEEAMSQTEIIRRVLIDGCPHSAYELARIIARRKYGGARIEHGIRIGARIWDLRRKGLAISGWRDEKNPRKFWYQYL